MGEMGDVHQIIRFAASFLRSLCLMVVFLLTAPGALWALEPEQVLVLANRNAARSIGLAKYYMERRGIPEDQLLALWVTDKETCSREDYEKKVLAPVLKYLEKHTEKDIRCLVTMLGVPLRVLPPELTKAEQELVDGLKARQGELREELRTLEDEDVENAEDAEDAEDDEKISHLKKQLRGQLDELKKRINLAEKRDHRASLDSEIALARSAPYELSMWIPNPHFLGYGGKAAPGMPAKEDVLMVSRLDGPGPEIVRRIIDDSIEAEKTGLTGTAYFDARWPRPSEDKEPQKVGYGFYDLSIHKAAELVKKSGRMPGVVNDDESLFQEGECPEAALYCGWYRLARYVDAFEWRPGSVGFHIASQECQTLRPGNSRVWCKRMLEEGVAATIGPVGEPYVQAFPIPEIFFGLLLEGRWTLAECYALSVPFWSWQMVLVGDPLYRPFQ